MERNLGVEFKRKNEMSVWAMLLLSLMLTFLVLLAVLPPVMTRHHLKSLMREVFLENASLGETSSSPSLSPGPTSQPHERPHNHNQASPDSDAVGPVLENDPSLVWTPHGLVRGVVTDRTRVFHGVPFARPPLQNLRWQPPQDVVPWSPSVLDATQERAGCPQNCHMPLICPRNTSEDCLNLEIFTPLPPSPVRSAYPVNVYLHGGSFDIMSSTSPIYDASDFVSRTDVIVVIVGYRLGALGFLVTGQSEHDARGNYGLLDQRAALAWVKANIEHFGGDPNKVTLSGQSAGAQSVLIHMTSPKSRRYFHRVIVESPPLTLRYKEMSEATRIGAKLADRLRCLNTTSSAVDLECLRLASVDSILEEQTTLKSKKSIESFMDTRELWGPAIDGDVVKYQALEALERYSRTTHDIPSLWGVMADEALMYVRSWLTSPTSTLMYTLSTSMIFKKPGDAKNVHDLYPIHHMKDTRLDISIVATDFLFRCPIKRSVRHLAESGVWVYTWAWSLGERVPQAYSQCAHRACHGMELPFIFQNLNSSVINFSESDVELSNTIIDYYARFIKFSDPNRDSDSFDSRGKTLHSSKSPYWPRVGVDHTDFHQLLFTKTGTVKVVDVRRDKRCDMWDKRGYSLNKRR